MPSSPRWADEDALDAARSPPRGSPVSFAVVADALQLSPEPPEAKGCCTVRRPLCGDPSLPLLLLLQGCRAADPSPCIHGSPPPCIVGGAGGYTIPACSPRCTGEAQVPLGEPSPSPLPLKPSYEGPESLVPLVDAALPKPLLWPGEEGWLDCKALLGCRHTGAPEYTYIHRGTVVDTGILYPRILYQCTLSYCERRTLEDDAVLEPSLPWVCIEGATRSYTLYCLGDSCKTTITADGAVEASIDAILVQEPLRTCPRARAARTMVAALLALQALDPTDPRDLAKAYRNARIYIAGPAAPLAARAEETSDRRALVKMLLWNPTPLTANITIRAANDRITEAKTWSPEHHDWQPLYPHHSEATTTLRGHGAAYTIATITRPPLLSRKKGRR